MSRQQASLRSGRLTVRAVEKWIRGPFSERFRGLEFVPF